MKVVIIGGVAGGMSTAFKAIRENPDLDITILEKEDYVSLGACGLPYYAGDVFEDEKRLFARTYEDAKKRNINLLQQHRVYEVDFNKKLVFAEDLSNPKNVEKKTFEYDHLVIATGAKAVPLNIEGIDSTNVYTITKPYIVKQLKEDLKDHKNIAIIGGGFIGVEMAEQLSKYEHLKINLYHSRDKLLNKVYDEKASFAIVNELQEHGVNVIFEERLQDVVAENGRVTEIITTNRRDEVDALILAVGFKPNTEIFTDERLEKIKNGAIVIDRYGRTSIKNVWSVGDCATVPHKFLDKVYIPLATSANKIGRQIGINLSRQPDNLFGPYESLASSSIKVGEMEFSTTGLTEKQAKELGFDYGVTEPVINSKPAYMPGSSPINFKIIYEKETYRILGARVFGKNDAVLRLLPFTTAIHAGLTTKDLGYYDYAYSPPFSLTWEAINTAANSAK